MFDTPQHKLSFAPSNYSAAPRENQVVRCQRSAATSPETVNLINVSIQTAVELATETSFNFRIMIMFLKILIFVRCIFAADPPSEK